MRAGDTTTKHRADMPHAGTQQPAGSSSPPGPPHRALAVGVRGGGVPAGRGSVLALGPHFAQDVLHGLPQAPQAVAQAQATWRTRGLTCWLRLGSWGEVVAPGGQRHAVQRGRAGRALPHLSCKVPGGLQAGAFCRLLGAPQPDAAPWSHMRRLGRGIREAAGGRGVGAPVGAGA